MRASGKDHPQYRHGQSHSNEHNLWLAIKNRCYNTRSPTYARYGGRGITVCAEWLNSFEAFYRDMGKRPKGLTLERKNNDLGYSKENCEWATRTTQARNRRSSRLLTHRGETLPVATWAERKGVSMFLIFGRLRQGWSIERAIEEPAKAHRPYVFKKEVRG